MKLLDLRKHLESCPQLAGAARAAWNGQAYITLGDAHGFMYLAIGDQRVLYGTTFEDAMADDWVPL